MKPLKARTVCLRRRGGRGGRGEGGEGGREREITRGGEGREGERERGEGEIKRGGRCRRRICNAQVITQLRNI